MSAKTCKNLLLVYNSKLSQTIRRRHQ